MARAGAVTAVVVLLLSSCGGDDEKDKKRGLGLDGGGDASAADASADASPEAGPNRPGNPAPPREDSGPRGGNGGEGGKGGSGGGGKGGSGGSGNPDEDAGTDGPQTCDDLDCSHLDDECSTGMCDEDTVTCISLALADGLACGSDVDDACTQPDSCRNGVCRGNHIDEGTPCGDQGEECRNDDACDGKGVCADAGFWDEGTSCGDQSDSECDNPDSCDAFGRCVPRHEPLDAPCGDRDVLCRYDDACDGAGKCVDKGTWSLGNCPFGASGSRCYCDDIDNIPLGFCNPSRSICNDAHQCVPSGASPPPDGTPCGDGSNTGCDNPDSCMGGICATNAEPPGTPCGDQNETACDFANTCDGVGTCQQNRAPVGTVCDFPPGACYLAPECDGAGNCGAAAFAPEGTACGNATNTVCNGRDTCDGAGTCQDNLAGGGVLCQNEGACSEAAFCDGAGSCPPRAPKAAGIVCAPAPGDCLLPRECDGGGVCAAALPAAPGTSCGDQNDNECTAPDECNDSGVCLPNHAAQGAPCGDQGVMCVEDDTCDGAGLCTDNGPTVGCNITVSGVLRDEATTTPIEGRTIEVVGGDSDTTDVDGNFTLMVPVQEPVIIRTAADASHWGHAQTFWFEPTDTTLNTFWSFDDTLIDAQYDVTPGLPNLDESKGIVVVTMNNNSSAGGESATSSADSAAPFVRDMGGMLVISDTLMGSVGDINFINTTPGSTTVVPTGAAGINDCSIQYPSITSWPVYAHTITIVPVNCVDL
jgi:hypothetical protein